MVYQGFVPFWFVVGIKDGVPKERTDPVLSTRGALSIPNTSGELLAPLPYLLPRVRQTEIPSVPEPPAAPCSHRKKSSLTLHACACFSGREPGASLLPPLPPPGLCSLQKKEHKCPGCLGTLALHLSRDEELSLFHFSVGHFGISAKQSALSNLPARSCVLTAGGTWTFRWSRL